VYEIQLLLELHCHIRHQIFTVLLQRHHTERRRGLGAQGLVEEKKNGDIFIIEIMQINTPYCFLIYWKYIKKATQ